MPFLCEVLVHTTDEAPPWRRFIEQAPGKIRTLDALFEWAAPWSRQVLLRVWQLTAAERDKYFKTYRLRSPETLPDPKFGELVWRSNVVPIRDPTANGGDLGQRR